MTTQHPIRLGPLAVAALLFASLIPFWTPSTDAQAQNPCVAYKDDPQPPGLPIRWDYGDAPDTTFGPLYTPPYPTYYTGSGNPHGFFPTLDFTSNSMILGQPGPRHDVVSHAWLGNVDAYDLDAQEDPLVLLGDMWPSEEVRAHAGFDEDLVSTNLDPATATPDLDHFDDGLLTGSLGAGSTGQLRVRVSTTAGMNDPWFVNVLVDWDFDGRWAGTDFTGAPEWAVVNMPVLITKWHSNLVQTPTFRVGGTPGEPWVRVTLTSDPIDATPYGAAGWDGAMPPGVQDLFGNLAFPCGETEDHCGRVTIAANNTDPPGGPMAPRDDETIRCDKRGSEEPVDDCQWHEQQSAYITDIRAGTTLGTPGASYYNGYTGLGFPSAVVSANGGLDVDIRHECVRQVWLNVDKVFSPAFTDPPGNIHSNTWTTSCTTMGTLFDHVSGIDAGVYEFTVSYWPCDENVVYVQPPQTVLVAKSIIKWPDVYDDLWTFATDFTP